MLKMWKSFVFSFVKPIFVFWFSDWLYGKNLEKLKGKTSIFWLLNKKGLIVKTLFN